LRCADCGVEKSTEDFPRNRRRPTGRGVHCKECHNRRGREFIRKKYGDTRHYHFRQKYGLSLAEVEILKSSQGGLCAVCRRQPALHVDHDHKSGHVRGVVCESCNGFLGAFGDDPALVQAAIEYLEKPR
jgi:hypothetical protein